MALMFNEASVPKVGVHGGVARQRLLDRERVNVTAVVVDRLTLPASASAQFDVPAKSVASLHMLDGEGTLQNTLYSDRMSDAHSAFLPPGLSATVSARSGISLLHVEVPNAARLDAGFTANRPLFSLLDWTREPVLQSKTDTRKRIQIVSPQVCNTAAIGIQMVIYPPGVAASAYHHEGAESFAYVVSGRGTCWTKEQTFPVQQGDLVYFADREPHCLVASKADELRFLIFYAPGTFKTIWTDPTKVSTWTSTNRDINGYPTAEDERERRARNSWVIGV